MVDGGKRTVNSVHTLPGLENLIVNTIQMDPNQFVNCERGLDL